MMLPQKNKPQILSKHLNIFGNVGSDAFFVFSFSQKFLTKKRQVFFCYNQTFLGRRRQKDFLFCVTRKLCKSPGNVESPHGLQGAENNQQIIVFNQTHLL